MGGSMSCSRLDNSQACGGCDALQECFYCIHGGENTQKDGNYCYTSTRAVGLQVMLPLAIILVLLTALYLTNRWRRLQLMRAQQLVYNPEVAKLEGGFAANSKSYTFRADILPYLLPCGVKNCVQFDVPTVQMTCSFGCLLILVFFILIPIAFFTVQNRVELDTLGNIHWWSNMLTAAINCICLGGFLCCLSCCFRCCLSRAKQQRFEAHHQRLARMANQALAAEGIVMAQPVPPHQTVSFHVAQPPMHQMMDLSMDMQREGVPLAIPYLPAHNQQYQYFAQPPGGVAPQSSSVSVTAEGVPNAYLDAGVGQNERYHPLPSSPSEQLSAPAAATPAISVTGTETTEARAGAADMV